MFTVLHKWDTYNAHSMDLVAKYLYQYYDTQTTEKLCLLFNMLESNSTQDANHSRWEADDRWIVHADDVAEVDWPGEKRLKRKHHMISKGEGDEDDKRTKAKRWDTFSKFLARIGFVKTSSKKSMAWVCSWNDNSGIFNRSKLVAAASTHQHQQQLHQQHTHQLQHHQHHQQIQHGGMMLPSPSSLPLPIPLNTQQQGISFAMPHTALPAIISPALQQSTPLSPTQVPISSSFYHPQQFIYPSSPSIQPLTSSDGTSFGYPSAMADSSAFMTPLMAHAQQYAAFSQPLQQQQSQQMATSLSSQPEVIESPPQPSNEVLQPSLVPLATPAATPAPTPSFPPSGTLSSYFRDIQESPYEYYENRGCVHAVNPMSIMSNILKYLRIHVHRNWENFNFTNRARVEANKQLIETVKDCGLEHALTRIPLIKVSEGHSISSQIRKQFPNDRTWEPEEYKSILLSVLMTPINQQVILRQRNLRFKNEKVTLKDLRKETAKAEFRLWSHVEPETQFTFPPALPSITKAYRYRDAYIHIATGLNLDSIILLRYGNQALKFVKSKTVMIILTPDNIELDTSILMKGVQHVGHNEYPVIPQIVNVNLVTNVPKQGTILFGSYLKYIGRMFHDSQEQTEIEFQNPQQQGGYEVDNTLQDDIKGEDIDFTILHPNALCAHNLFSRNPHSKVVVCFRPKVFLRLRGL